jgi:hypothetical protein
MPASALWLVVDATAWLVEPTPLLFEFPQPGAAESGTRMTRESEIRVRMEGRTEVFMREMPLRRRRELALRALPATVPTTAKGEDAWCGLCDVARKNGSSSDWKEAVRDGVTNTLVRCVTRIHGGTRKGTAVRATLC